MTQQQKIQHLFWRAGFGLSPKEWKERNDWSVEEAVQYLFKKAEVVREIKSDSAYTNMSIEEFRNLSKTEKQELQKQDRKLVAEQNIEWLKRMADVGESALLERMSLFWHGHFACVSKGSKMASTQLNTIRKHALGSFRDLVLAISKDPSMIRFLNNQQNRKNSPNENFARELMELFTIGRGNYTENDIKEAARAFTGWSSNLRGDFIFRKRQHDYGKKIFMGKSGNFNGEEIIDIILEKRETALFICQKIYRYFVNDKIEEGRVQDLADIFYHSDYNIGTLMKVIFESEWFYAPENIGCKIKSPIEFLAGMMRQLEISFENDRSVIRIQKALGQQLFNPPNVAGWSGGKNWIDNSTLIFRLNLAGWIINNSEINYVGKADLEAAGRNKGMKNMKSGLNLIALQEHFTRETKRATMEAVDAFLLQSKSGFDLTSLNSFIRKDSDSAFMKTLTWRVMSLPEYQMC